MNGLALRLAQQKAGAMRAQELVERVGWTEDRSAFCPNVGTMDWRFSMARKMEPEGEEESRWYWHALGFGY